MNKSQVKLSSGQEKPLITFAVLSYNHEKYILEAIQGALSQTYTPLEIILSDDCSTDRTFEIMQSVAEQYHGKHKLVVRKNSENLGLAEHINTVFETASGSWVVISGGDDISLESRTAEIVGAVEKFDDILLVHSDHSSINEDGTPADNLQQKTTSDDTGQYIINDIKQRINFNAKPVHGATAAYSIKLFKKFPPLPKDGIYEDAIMMMRSEMIGRSCFINKALVKYRSHCMQITNVNTENKIENKKKLLKNTKGSLVSAITALRDYYHITKKNLIDKEVENYLKKKITIERYKCKAISSAWPLKIIYLLLFILVKFPNQKVSKQIIKIAIFPRN